MELTFMLRVFLSVFFTAAVLATIWLPARAHSPNQFLLMGEPNEEWLRGLKNNSGVLCCDGKDGVDVQYDTKDGAYRVWLYNAFWVVPNDKVITEPNRLGMAQVWYSTSWGSDGVPKPFIRCFIPGSLT